AVTILSTVAVVQRARMRSLRAAPAVEGLSRLGTPAVWLLTAQVSLACTVVAGALLMTTAVARVIGDDRGYVTTGVWTARITVPGEYDLNRTTSFLTRLGERLSNMPGIADVSFATCAPGAGRCRQSNILSVDGVPMSRDSTPQIGIQIVSPGAFRTIGARITRGRDLDVRDASSAPGAVMITDTLAQRLWPGADPVGHQLEVYTANGSLAGLRTVVGTVGPIRFNVDDDPGLDVFLPVSQAAVSSVVVFMKGTSPTRDRMAGLVRETAALDPRIPVYDPASLEARLADSLSTERLLERAFIGFGAVALLLALLGVYAITAQAVSNCERELAVRMALGATAGQIRALVARRGMVVAVLGSSAGCAMAFFSSRLLQSMLHGVPNDHLILFAAPVLTGLALALTIVWPIRKAHFVNVLIAMRAD
ncbi:MAG TPA: FtsX-like permease family protein, partial [Vicinamibacterales bacterium]|nr:FtsX-like permease family protein [Vicinamibacterales bacterium]